METAKKLIELENARDLWAAVMWMAIEDLAGEGYECRSRMERKRAQKGARAWFKSRKGGVSTFKFCCDVLGFDPDATRRRILGHPGVVIMPTTIGGAIGRYRARIQITQAELAKRLGTNPSTLSLVEGGGENPRSKRPICAVVANKARELLRDEAPDLIQAGI